MIAGTVDVHAQVHVLIEREPSRARCAFCRVRRVLYRVLVSAFGALPSASEARCAECWGMEA